MRFAQGAYSICPDDGKAVAFVEFIHLHGTRLLRAVGGSWAPRVYVSLMEAIRNHVARTGLTVGVFLPDIKSSKLHAAKHYLHGFTIKFLHKQSSTYSTGGLKVFPPRDYKGQFH